MSAFYSLRCLSIVLKLFQQNWRILSAGTYAVSDKHPALQKGVAHMRSATVNRS